SFTSNECFINCTFRCQIMSNIWGAVHLRVIRHFSFHYLHFPQIISPLTVSAPGAFLEAIA
ncbi:hypothetical protein PO324_08980, partial [Escherichia coli]